jgi:hypothetical protein
VMLLSVLVVLALAGGLGQPAATVSWAACENGEPADLRADIPVLVLTSTDSETYVPFFTAFVLYADGGVVARRGNQMFEWRAEKRRAPSFWKQVSGDQLFALDEKFDRTTDRQRERSRSAPFDYRTTETEVHIWKDGCHKRISVRGLNLLVAEDVVNGRHAAKASLQELEDAGNVLATLPAVLSQAVRGMLAFGTRGGRKWCDFKDCFAGTKQLPHHELWEPEPRITGR